MPEGANWGVDNRCHLVAIIPNHIKEAVSEGPLPLAPNKWQPIQDNQ